MMACQGLPSNSFVTGVLDYIDCQAQTIGAGGYQALASPGSTLSLVLAGLLTLFVAFFGYRMLFGETLTVRDGVLAMVKIGIVLALATGWPAYRTLIYDVALKGPAELAGEIGGPSALPGAGGGLVARLDYADQSFLALGILGTGEASGAPQATTPQQQQPPPGVQPGRPMPLVSFNELLLGGARVLFLAGAIGAIAIVRLVAGLLLALGPFFIAFLLFEGTRGLFEGWLRVLGAAALGALGTAILLGVELALIEPWLANLLAYRLAGYQTPGVAVELFAVSLIFAATLAAMLYAIARVAYGFRLPAAWRSAPAQLAEALRGGESLRVSATAQDRIPANVDRPRAVTIADAVAATQRRETPMPAAAMAAAGGAPSRTVIPPGHGRDPSPPPPTPLGQSYSRRTRTRHSGSASRRDRGA
jgi:type IV secretion system protein VirB6